MMTKEEAIAYLNSIKPYINLKAICEDYNNKGYSPIDYNKLRAVLNGISESRLSESKINSFINYLYHDLYINKFKISKIKDGIQAKTVSNIVFSYAEEISKALIKELNNEV